MSDYPGQCFVYLICTDAGGRLEGPCKIGISDKPWKRLKQVQTGNPNKLTLAVCFRMWDRNMASLIENSFHAAHDERRLQGEWFDVSAKDALRGIIDVFVMGMRHILKDQPDAREMLNRVADACGITEASILLYRIYEAEGTLKKTLVGLN